MAIISQSRKFIFVHIPECGGLSVAKSLSIINTYMDLEIGVTNFGKRYEEISFSRFGLGCYATTSEIRSVLGHSKWLRYFKFAFVMDPLTRFIWSFNFLKRNQNKYTFMKRINTPEELFELKEWKGSGPFRLFDPQYNWVRARSHNYSLGIDFIGKSENMKKDFGLIIREIAEPHERDALSFLPEKNVDKDSINVSEQTKKTILKRYEVDYEEFGY